MGIVQDKIQKIIYGESYVHKAQLTFYDLKDAKGNNIKNTQWDVMLNPSSIRRQIGRQTIIDNGTGKDGGYNITPRFREEHISMQLIFDIVDAYDAYMNNKSTKNLSFSMIHYAYLKDNMVAEEHKYPQKFRFLALATTEDEITLENDEISCLPYLIKVAGAVDEGNKPQSFVRFEWGGLSIDGYVTDLSINYNYFSNNGYPLRAYVDLTIYRIPDSTEEDADDGIQANDVLNLF